jgi:5-methylcytosine-specific restriction endonuclease McrA
MKKVYTNTRRRYKDHSRALPEHRELFEKRHLKRTMPGVECSLTWEEWGRVLKHYAFRCLRCGTVAGKMNFDHIFPVSRGGATALWNSQPLCGPCNRIKYIDAVDYRHNGLQGLISSRFPGTLQGKPLAVRMTARFNGVCVHCRKQVLAGADCMYWTEIKRVEHRHCFEKWYMKEPLM